MADQLSLNVKRTGFYIIFEPSGRSAFVCEQIDSVLFPLKQFGAFSSRRFQLNTNNNECRYDNTIFSPIPSASILKQTPPPFTTAPFKSHPLTGFCRLQFPRGFCTRQTEPETEKEIVVDKRNVLFGVSTLCLYMGNDYGSDVDNLKFSLLYVRF